jgi:hypothetical protein
MFYFEEEFIVINGLYKLKGDVIEILLLEYNGISQKTILKEIITYQILKKKKQNLL